MAIIARKLAYKFGHQHATDFMACLDSNDLADTSAFAAGAIMGIARYLQKKHGAAGAAGILYAAADTIAADASTLAAVKRRNGISGKGITSMRILLASADPDIRNHLRIGLKADRHVVELCADGEIAIEHISMSRFHCAIIDERLADMPALEYLRRAPSLPHVPTIVIGCIERGAPEALDLGADDYLPRPFHLAELKARVLALARRWNGHATNRIEIGAYHFDLEIRELFCGETSLWLAPKPTAILEALALANGETLSKEQLLILCWGAATKVEMKIVDVLICHIRKKAPDLVQTLWGRGYCINCNAELASDQIGGKAA